jgi:hypothetical protein
MVKKTCRACLPLEKTKSILEICKMNINALQTIRTISSFLLYFRSITFDKTRNRGGKD